MYVCLFVCVCLYECILPFPQNDLLFLYLGPLQESAIWIDETQTYNVMYRHSHGSSPIASDGPDDPLGLSDEANE